jgi:hypothetical protein
MMAARVVQQNRHHQGEAADKRDTACLVGGRYHDS